VRIYILALANELLYYNVVLFLSDISSSACGMLFPVSKTSGASPSWSALTLALVSLPHAFPRASSGYNTRIELIVVYSNKNDVVA
jgi:hypothetical protein